MLLKIHWRLIFASAIRCSRLRLWVGYFIHFKFTPALLFDLLIDVLYSIKGINRLIEKECQTFT